MKTIALLTLLICPMLALAQWDFQMDSLPATWRLKGHSGPTHCTASAKLRATDTSLIVEVHVTDDHLVLTDDPVNSDHIELWFALPRLYGNPYPDDYFTSNSPACFYGGGSSFFLYTRENTLRAFQKEIRSPEIDASDNIEDSLSYDHLNNEDYSWLKSLIDEYLADARTPSIKKAYAFFGMVHFGILPKSNRAVLYEPEAYSIIAKQIGVDLPDYSKLVKVESVLGKNEYTATIVLSPEALGFISRSGLELLQFLVDVVDTDSLGKQETLLSSSPKRKWGIPETFNTVGFDGGVHASILPEFKEFGHPYIYGGRGPTLGAKLLDPLSRVFLFTSKGWMPVERVLIPFEANEGRFGYGLPNIQKWFFKPGKLSYRQEMLGKHSIATLTATHGEFLIVDNKEIYPNDDVVLTFLLPDSSIGFIGTKGDIGGQYNKLQTSALYLRANGDETLLAEFQELDTVSVRLLGNQVVKESAWDPNKVYWNSEAGESFAWSSLLVWETVGTSLVLDFGNGQRFRVSWDRRGQNVKLIKL